MAKWQYDPRRNVLVRTGLGWELNAAWLVASAPDGTVLAFDRNSGKVIETQTGDPELDAKKLFCLRGIRLEDGQEVTVWTTLSVEIVDYLVRD
jgi:hypothetical protein